MQNWSYSFMYSNMIENLFIGMYMYTVLGLLIVT